MGRKKSWTDDQLRRAVDSSLSIASVLRSLGLKPTGANYKSIEIHMDRMGLDRSHFTGSAWNTGDRYRPVMPARPYSEILVKDSTFSTSHLKKRLVKDGMLEYLCSECGITDWNNLPLSLQMHHINGDHRDNRISNLCLLCPNCHSQTSTFTRRKSSIQ